MFVGSLLLEQGLKTALPTANRQADVSIGEGQ